MPSKRKLLEKLYQKEIPKNFTVQESQQLMKKCHCICASGGRGSSIKFYHTITGRILQFDEPHPGKELYTYQIKMMRKFIEEIHENTEDE